jgi:hypothetical protein
MCVVTRLGLVRPELMPNSSGCEISEMPDILDDLWPGCLPPAKTSHRTRVPVGPVSPFALQLQPPPAHAAPKEPDVRRYAGAWGGNNPSRSPSSSFPRMRINVCGRLQLIRIRIWTVGFGNTGRVLSGTGEDGGVEGRQ